MNLKGLSLTRSKDWFTEQTNKIMSDLDAVRDKIAVAETDFKDARENLKDYCL